MFNPYQLMSLLDISFQNYRSKILRQMEHFLPKISFKFKKTNSKKILFQSFQMPFDLKPQRPYQKLDYKSGNKRLMINGISNPASNATKNKVKELLMSESNVSSFSWRSILKV